MTFDPYYKLLGIPPQEQPPSHYRLLGISLFETDGDVIAAAADRQISFLKSSDMGLSAQDSEKMLTELSEASLCLLDPAKKAAYDLDLSIQRALSEEVLPAARMKPQRRDPWGVASVPSGRSTVARPWGTPYFRAITAGVTVALLLMFGLWYGQESGPRKSAFDEQVDTRVPVVSTADVPEPSAGRARPAARTAEPVFAITPQLSPSALPLPSGATQISITAKPVIPANTDEDQPIENLTGFAAERAVARWVCARPNGTIRVALKSGKSVPANQEIPAEDFSVTWVNVKDDPGLTDEQLRMLAKLSRLEGLHFENVPISGDFLRSLRESPTLRQVTLIGSEFSDAALREIGTFHNLNILVLQGTRVTDDGINALAGLSSLQCLWLVDVPLTDKALGDIASIPSLRTLVLKNSGGSRVTKVDDSGIQHLSRLRNLQKLDLANTDITDAALLWLKELDGLERLIVDGTNVSDAGVAELEGNTSLKAVSLRQTRISSTGAAKLNASLPKCNVAGPSENEVLLVANVVDGSVDVEANVLPFEITIPAPEALPDDRPLVERLLNLSAHVTVEFFKNGKFDKIVPYLGDRIPPGILRLTRVSCTTEEPIPADDLRLLGSLPYLKIASFGPIEIDDAGLDAIAKSTSIERLELRLGNVSDSWATRMAGMSALNFLRLWGDGVTDARLSQLTALEKLTILMLADGNFTATGLQLLQIRSLLSLEIQHTIIGDAGLLAIKQIPNLSSLNLQQVGVSATGFRNLSGSSLRQLILNGKDFGDAEMEGVSGLQLSSLLLSDGSITDVGLNSLAGLQRLHTINLTDCPIRGDEWRPEGNCWLKMRSAWFGGTKLSDQGVKTLVSAAPNLTLLSLRGTSVTNAGLVDVARLSQLKTLDLQQTAVSTTGLLELRALPELQQLALTCTQAEAAEIWKILPNCQINLWMPPK